MPITNSINTISTTKAITEISKSNVSAINNAAQYPIHERTFLLNCCDFVNRDCDQDCACREFTTESTNSNMCWVIKKDCDLHLFKESFTQLWIANNFQGNFRTGVRHRRINRALDIFSLINTSIMWHDICNIANSNRRCIVCSEPLNDGAKSLINTIHIEGRNIFDRNKIYDSKFLSQIFYDSLVPHDTNSAIAMRSVDYSPSKNGLDMSKHIREFMRKNKINISELRQLDDAPSKYWSATTVGNVSQPCQALSRVIDKLFYVP